MTTVPLIDLDRWFSGDDVDRAELAADVNEHLCRLGFLLVINHRVPKAVIDDCREQCRQFFHLPAEDKAHVALTGEAYRGWVGPGLESNAATYGIDTPPDLKETFAYGPVDVPDESLRVSKPVTFAPNRWPAEPAEFQTAAEAWWRAGKVLADELLELCSLALGLPQGRLGDACRATTAQVSLNWYGPRGDSEPEPDQFRVGPHTDFGTLTILDREPGAGGLQVRDEHGEWIDAPYVEGSLLINTGDLIRRWTNDRWCSNQHRVLPPPAHIPTEELISLVFFHEPDDDALIEALETCVDDEHPALHPPVIAHDYLAMKMAALEVS
jgi:isopenicillin N synthase-like dioxygenase